MKTIDPKSELAEVLFYQQFMTEMHQGLNTVRGDLSQRLFDNVSDDIQYIAFAQTVTQNNFEIRYDEKTEKAEIVDLLGDNTDRKRLFTAFNRIANKLAVAPTMAADSSSLAI